MQAAAPGPPSALPSLPLPLALAPGARAASAADLSVHSGDDDGHAALDRLERRRDQLYAELHRKRALLVKLAAEEDSYLCVALAV